MRIYRNNTGIEENRRLYHIWRRMKSVCKNKNHEHYKYYGERGITICDEWLDFDNFADWAHLNGYEIGLSIERIDVNGNYCPENCCWIPVKDQQKNKRNTYYVIHNGEKRRLIEVCNELGICKKTIIKRIKNGMTAEKAIEKTILDNKNKALTDKCKKYNIKPSIVRDRMKKLGWSEEMALTVRPRVLKRERKEAV